MSEDRILIDLICAYDQNEALARVLSGQCNLDYIDDQNKATPLIYACIEGYYDLVCALIATGKSYPGHTDKYGYTALMYACDDPDCDNDIKTKIALALIATGESNPNHIAGTKNVLWLAANCGLYQVAYVLITNDFDNSEVRCEHPKFIKFIDNSDKWRYLDNDSIKQYVFNIFNT